MVTQVQSGRYYLQLPHCDRDAVSHCAANTRALQHWLEQLPRANLGECATQLYHGVIEFNQIDLTASKRWDIAELLREHIITVCAALDQKYLCTTPMLQDNQRKIATLLQSLQAHMATSYKHIVQQLITSKLTAKTQHRLMQALYRMASELSTFMLRCLYLHLPMPQKLWYEWHQLMVLADAHDISHHPVSDPHHRHYHQLSLNQLYSGLLLAYSSQANQLSQQQLRRLTPYILHGAAYVERVSCATAHSVIVFNPDVDQGPCYRYLIKPDLLPQYQGLHTERLISALSQQLSTYAPEIDLDDSPNESTQPALEDGLLQHLIQAWSASHQRIFNRTLMHSPVDLCLGLHSAHFYIGDKRSFDNQLFPSSEPLHRSAQSTDQPKPPAPSAVHDDAPQPVASFDEKDHGYVSATLVNISPRGYCLDWIQRPGVTVQAGGLGILGVSDNHNSWDVGLIRWLQQLDAHKLRMGIERIAPQVQACGVRQWHQNGQHGEYMRALLIPQISAINQPASLIVARMPLQTGHRIRLNQQGLEQPYQLSQLVLSTQGVNQFNLLSL